MRAVVHDGEEAEAVLKTFSLVDTGTSLLKPHLFWLCVPFTLGLGIVLRWGRGGAVPLAGHMEGGEEGGWRRFPSRSCFL